ncbi:hypothetical protein NM688_g2803 [Phlebia brevispora]|uniref:Uncharacterized protein n=1 Tax=Phlebia brevispora TaxID=194682 RepID=A0ACC1T7Z0_9APHY|nr:hypothetical protein NM688_g2803 [Phlebia brevispora]
MSTAHRPTWDPAQAKDVKGGSRQFSVRDMAAHTKLKFRQPGQTSVDEVKKRDLRAELLAAEAEARDKKRKAEGKPPLAVENGAADEEANKRRKLLQEAIEMDKDEDEDEERSQKGEGESKHGDDEEDEDEDSDEDEDDEDDTAELLRELEKIKRERAEEKERQDREQSEQTAAEREYEVATANPLLNLAAALGQTPGVNTTIPGTFAVKRRWDDDLIFKNQAMGDRDKDKRSGQFVNDLLRTEFHKKFMAKFIKLLRLAVMHPSVITWFRQLQSDAAIEQSVCRPRYGIHRPFSIFLPGLSYFSLEVDFVTLEELLAGVFKAKWTACRESIHQSFVCVCLIRKLDSFLFGHSRGRSPSL